MALAPVYILSSDDPFLKKEKSDLILNEAKAQYPNAEFLLFTQSDFGTSGAANLARLETELIDPGLFATDKIIKIYFENLNNIALQVLHLVAKYPRPGVVVIVECNRLNKKLTQVSPKPYQDTLKKGSLDNTTKTVFSYLLNIKASIEILYPPVGREFIRWMSNQAQKYNLVLSPEVVEYLALSTEGNLVCVDQFFMLVKMTQKDNVIKLKTAQDYISQSSRYGIYEFIDAMLAPNAIKALNVLNSLYLSQNNKSSMLQSICFALDNVLLAIKAARADSQFLKTARTYADKSSFFRAYKISSLSTIDACLFAARNMPQDLIDYLVKELCNVSYALQVFDEKKAYICLENMAMSGQYLAARQFGE